MSASDSEGLPGEVEAAGQSNDLRASKKHKKRKKHKKHWDKCEEPTQCESVELHADSHEHTEARKELEREIRVKIPGKLPALYWGSEVEAELVFEHEDSTVVCTYNAQRHGFGRSLQLDSCDNGAVASDTITFDSVTLKLSCSDAHFAKVHVKLHELEPCGETSCDPDEVDDGDPCTVDACDEDGTVTHTPAADGTSCDDGNVCNGHECCVAGDCVRPESVPLECGSQTEVVFYSNFDDTLPGEFAPGSARLTGVQGYAGLGTDPRKFGGKFLRSATENLVTLQLDNLPPHDTLDLRFLFAAIDSLDGSGTYPAGESFIIRVDDTVIFSESFANSGDNKVQSYNPPDGVTLARRVELGFRNSDVCYVDSAYDMGKDPTFQGLVHTASSVTISFEYVGEGAQIIEDESWAIDELEVSVSRATTCEDCGEPAPVVDDGNPCTSDSCDPVLGVDHTPVAAGTSCGIAANPCDTGPTCNAQGECVSGTPRVCDDGRYCNGTETCDPQAGCVAGTAVACDDGDACTGTERCDDSLGACVAGEPLVAEDNNLCTVDSCYPERGIVHENVPNGTTCGMDRGCFDGRCEPLL